MTSALTKALGITCSQYSGIKKDQVQALLKCGDVLQAYFILTQTSQKLANDTKADFFLEIRKLIGAIGKNNLRNDMDGMEVTQRTGTWRKNLLLLVPWWMEPTNLEETVSRRCMLTTDPEDGTVNQASKFSSFPLEIGTYIHEAFGESITAQCAKMFGWNTLEYIVPGRIVHAGLPWIGVTPDAICVVDERAFHFISRKLLLGEIVSSTERGAGAPWMTIEMKTIHGQTMRENADENPTVREQEIDQLYSVYENDYDPDKMVTKEAALKLLVKKLELAGWIPENLYAEDNDYLLEKNEVKLKKTANSKKRKTCAFFKKSTILYPTKQFKNLRVEDVGGEVYPNLAKLPSETLRVTYEPPKKKRTCVWNCVVPLKKMVTPGKACMIVYAIGKTVVNEMLFHLIWEEAPFMLTLNSDHFNQVMGQHATARQLNEQVKSVFAVTFRSHRSPSTNFGTDPIQLAIVYAYDVGIQAEAVDAYSDVISREIALAAQGIENSESLYTMLLKNTSLADRSKTLYRRASVFQTLPEPSTDDVFDAYRQAFNDLCDKDLSLLDEWNADDVE